jgi:hypothetical protein
MIDDLLLILSDYLESMEQGEWGRADALRAEMRLFVPRLNTQNDSGNSCEIECKCHSPSMAQSHLRSLTK